MVSGDLVLLHLDVEQSKERVFRMECGPLVRLEKLPRRRWERRDHFLGGD